MVGVVGMVGEVDEWYVLMNGDDLCSSWINEWLWLVCFMYKYPFSPLVYVLSEVTKSLSCREWKIRVVVEEYYWKNKIVCFLSVDFFKILQQWKGRWVSNYDMSRNDGIFIKKIDCLLQWEI